FNLDEPVVDGNIRRVFSRLFDIEKPIGSAEAEAAFWSLAAENLPSGQAGEFNQALMDLGAVVCLPKNPRCGSCPVSGICQARRLGIQDQRPVRKPRREIPHYTVAAAVIEDGERVLITRRPQDALLGGMWEFPGGKIRPDEALEEGLQREIKEELGVQVRVGEACGTYHHAYTHYRITLHAFRCRLAGGRPEPLEVDEIQWAHFDDLTEYPMGKIDRMISSTIQK
ncbi:MAG: NUDIX domain-containing protein, partial [Anaerolineales bacterium]|nr:NUDIX domain-containing protein [Anaerolineales bacterium]